jgi:hypothetical protein
LEADPVLETEALEADPVLETEAPETDPVLETKAPETDPVLETEAPETDPVLETKAPETDPVLENEVVLTDAMPNHIDSVTDVDESTINSTTGVVDMTTLSDHVDMYKLRFVHAASWGTVDLNTRHSLDSRERNRTDGQLLVLHKVPNIAGTNGTLFDSLFITSLATESTKSHPMYAHVAKNGSVILSIANANEGTMPIFRIQHGDVISDTCINTANFIENGPIYHCTFPSSHSSSVI